MEPMQHQMMGYDRAITMFSPDGRLLQVEYAKKTVKQGSTAVGIKSKDGLVLAADKRIVDKLIIPSSIEKIVVIDEHIIATGSGILSDARILFERAQLRAQQHRLTYDSPIDTLSVVKDIANLKQMTTQSGGLRPFGVSLLIAGFDETGNRLFLTDPTGIYFEYYATAIGQNEAEANKIIEEKYKKDISTDDAIKLAIEAISKTIESKEDERIDCVYIDNNKKIQRLSQSDIKKYIKH